MKISVCIVNHNNDDLIKLNHEFLKKKNNDLEIEFIVGCNTAYRFQSSDIIAVEGIPADQCLMNDKNTKDQSLWGKKKGGNQHAVCLEKCISRATHRFVVTLDPDFFVLVPLNIFVSKILDGNLAIIGSPYGYVQEFNQHKNHHVSPVGFLPTCIFTLIDRDKYNENIILDPRQSNDQYYSWEDKVDTSLPFRESLHKYRYETLNVCINGNCSICMEMGVQYMQDQPGKFRGGCERYFLDNQLCGVHYHYRDGYVEKIKQLLQSHVHTKTYHPLPNFVK